MREFMDENFLLDTETARKLYHETAAALPIVDYHCHIDPREIAEDRHYETPAQLWLEGDHYKWRLMRANGAEERLVTGDAEGREKFQAWAAALERAAGNPLYHWSHLELQRYFGCRTVLNADSAEAVWNHCCGVLEREKLSARSIIAKSNAAVICTTDDPADSLEWHGKLAADESFSTRVLPAWRPDRAVNIEKEEFTDYIRGLGQAADMKITSFEELQEALRRRMDYFAERGCCISDHGLDYVVYVPDAETEAAALFHRRLEGECLSEEETAKYKTALMLFFGREYRRRGWAMQLHFGARRSNNTKQFRLLGADTGFDCISTHTPLDGLIKYLDALNSEDMLPKTILYSLNPSDNMALGTIAGCFAENKEAGWLQHGSAWWFNDNRDGMEAQLKSLANTGLLGNFIGMLTDSRSFLSYTRHEYFRRILCGLLGRWAENGEYPADESGLKKLTADICFNNCIRYFGFGRKE